MALPTFAAEHRAVALYYSSPVIWNWAVAKSSSSVTSMWDRQTDDRFIDPAPHTISAMLIKRKTSCCSAGSKRSHSCCYLSKVKNTQLYQHMTTDNGRMANTIISQCIILHYIWSNWQLFRPNLWGLVTFRGGNKPVPFPDIQISNWY